MEKESSMKDTVNLTVKFPREYYPLLKMYLAQQGKTLIDFASDLIIKEIKKNKDK
jgi:hypothetical protein